MTLDGSLEPLARFLELIEVGQQLTLHHGDCKFPKRCNCYPLLLQRMVRV